MKNVTETLGIGSRAPEFRLGAANGSREISLSELLRHSPVVLEFLRGTWCHNCRKRMIDLEKVKDEIVLEGGQLVCVAAEKRAGLWEPEEYLKKNPLSYPFLLDEDRSVIKAYGLYHRIGIDAWNVAHPATLVLDREGRLRYIHKGTSQSDRAPLEDVMKALRKVIAVPTMSGGSK